MPRLSIVPDQLQFFAGTDIEAWGISPRGAGFLFGGDVAAKVYFLKPQPLLSLSVYMFVFRSFSNDTTTCTNTVQPQQQLKAHMSCAPTGYGRVQVDVQKSAGHSLVSPKLLLSVCYACVHVVFPVSGLRQQEILLCILSQSCCFVVVSVEPPRLKDRPIGLSLIPRACKVVPEGARNFFHG